MFGSDIVQINEEETKRKVSNRKEDKEIVLIVVGIEPIFDTTAMKLNRVMCGHKFHLHSLGTGLPIRRHTPTHQMSTGIFSRCRKIIDEQMKMRRERQKQ